MTTTIHNATGGNADAPSTAPEPQLDPVMLAHEADQAWAAYGYALRNLNYTQARLTTQGRLLSKNQPLLAAFERIAGHVYGWMLGAKDASEVMEAIKADVERGRQEADSG